MKLKNNLYQILSSDPDTHSFRLALLPDCIIYKAHFPEQPITPGVCIIGMATELLGELLTGTIELDHVSNAKYLSVIDPRETQEVNYIFKKITTEEEEGRIRVQVVVSNGEKIFTKLSLGYKWDTKTGMTS